MFTLTGHAVNRSVPRLVLAAVIMAMLVPRGLSAQDAARTFGRAGTGFGTGVTVSAIALSGMLNSGSGNACTGSGNYLAFCRFLFVGGTALGGGLGAIVGALVRRDASAGRVRPTLLGSAAGSVVPFLVSLGNCEQEEERNPETLCGRDGMVNPGITMAGAAAGALAGYLMGGLRSGLEVTQIGPALTTKGTSALGVALHLSWSF